MSNDAPRRAAARDAMDLLAGAGKAALATLDRVSGGPYASLVLVALSADRAPILLLSRLAAHTRNIEADARASLLFEAKPDGTGDVMAANRVSLLGRLAITSGQQDRAVFLAAHATAAVYADFADFAFYRFEVEHAHFIGGFGRIVDLSAHDLAAARAAI